MNKINPVHPVKSASILLHALLFVSKSDAHLF